MQAQRPQFWRSSETGPRLLVSVRSADEARAALAGGADILDVKEPARGPLGWADESTLDDIARVVSASGSDIPLTAALGEVRDWSGAVPRVPPPFTLRKLGLAGLSTTSDWVERWQRVRRRIDQHNTPAGWVAVAYADAHLAEAPPVEDVLRAGIETGCRGLLIDTFQKAQDRLTDLVTFDHLQSIALQAHEGGLFLAIAGRLQITDLAQLADGPADIVGVRSATCPQGDRSGALCPELTARCRGALRRTSDSAQDRFPITASASSA